MTARPSLSSSFTRSQVASVAATVVDFGTLIFFVEILRVWYVAATAIGAFVGAITNFLMGRYWSFQATHRSVRGQALRYALVSSGSLALNSAGVYLLTDHVGFRYVVSKAITAFLVGIAFNFPMHRHFVFKH